MNDFTATDVRNMRIAPLTARMLPTPTHYVVTVQHGTSERVAFGLRFPLSKRAAGQLQRALTGLYKGAPKLRAIMVKTAIKDGILG